MKELIFNIEDIFNDSTPSGCLSQYGCVFFHIPAYQRGYKWSCEPNGAVTILLNDLWEAFLSNPYKEYYLQYITVKKITRNEACLEVIDGQQRLTTLSILLSVIFFILKSESNIAINKLDYAVRDNFFTNNIYREDGLKNIVMSEWKIFILENVEFNKQDIFYLHGAVRKCYSFYEEKQEKLADFIVFLRKSVKLIVNSVESYVSSELVFKNLNSNKIALTEVELIKGLFITKSGRFKRSECSPVFREVLDARIHLGRKWDEITHWSKRSDVTHFFFNGKSDSGMHELLKLTAMQFSGKTGRVFSEKSSENYQIFNFFHQEVDIKNLFYDLLNIQSILNDWFDNNEVYNLLGFCRFVKGSQLNNLAFLKECLHQKDKSDLISFLRNKRNSLLSIEEINNLRYGESPDVIHAILLAINVFSEGSIIRFNFLKFSTEKWSLEHIFPQTPEGKGNVLQDTHKKAIIDMLGENATESIRLIISKPSRSDDERCIYETILKETSILDSIGNMCLLTQRDNSSNGCQFFNEKRRNILKLLQNGSFVPKHTFDVFSKMIAGLEDSDISVWSQKDIAAHQNYIARKLEIIKDIL